MHRLRPGHASSPRVLPIGEPAEEEEELSTSLQGHDVHFLERTARLRGPELNRAMRLYHHSAIVKRVLAAQRVRSAEGRVAIAISDHEPSAHVIVSSDGVFVTCLSGGMRTSRVPVLPYHLFEPAMDEADAAVEQQATRRRQLMLLDPSALIEALVRGPGFIDEDMARIVELCPLTYVVPVHLSAHRAFDRYVKLAKAEYQVRVLLLRDRHDRQHILLRRRIWRHACVAEGTLKLCAYLFGAMDTQPVTDWLGVLISFPSPIQPELALAAARHDRGSEVLLKAARSPHQDPSGRRTLLQALTHHVIHHPRQLRRVATAVRQEPQLREMLSPGHVLAEPSFSSMSGPQVELAVGQLVAHLPALPPYPTEGTGLPDLDYLDLVGLRREPVSRLFPPREQTQQVRQQWQRHISTPPPYEPPRIHPVVRATPRIGRNAPCPCGSGRKYKRCCLGQPAVPAVASGEEVRQDHLL
ncbi:MAG: SEC-C metal-binding domain-containing protein [Myxococcales bacterium]|nr:SEC-C metal-binding domain-containing protein [Myxococcota bacterium]MDW8282290.1 SEC-C metal-binding domain-containing protein [Myxococcales bacterium]